MKIEILSISERENGGVIVKIRLSDGDHGDYAVLPLTDNDYLRINPIPKTEIDTAKYEEIEEASLYCKALDKGAELLTYGANSKKMLVTKLRRRGYTAEISERAADELERCGFFNEDGDAESYIRVCISKGYGKRRIIMALRQKGFTDDVIVDAMTAAEKTDFCQLCAKTIEKKYHTLPSDRVSLNKITAAMVRYGYSFSEIKSAYNIIKNR